MKIIFYCLLILLSTQDILSASDANGHGDFDNKLTNLFRVTHEEKVFFTLACEHDTPYSILNQSVKIQIEEL